MLGVRFAFVFVSFLEHIEIVGISKTSSNVNPSSISTIPYRLVTALLKTFLAPTLS